MEKRTESSGSAALKIKLFTGPGTRRWPRFSMADVPYVKGVRSSAGSVMEVDNISLGGALLQTRKRLMPGSRIQLRFVNTEGEIPLTGFVLRSSISSPKGMPRYQTAVAFDSPLQVPDIQPGQAAESLRLPVPRSSSFKASPSDGGESFCELIRNGESALSAAFFAVSAYSAQDAALCTMLKHNDW